MSLATAAEIVTIVGGSVGTANVVGSTIYKTLQSLRPYSKYKKWTIRVQQIAAVVASAAAEGDLLTPEELEGFLKVLGLYAAARDTFHERIKDGSCMWIGFGKNKKYAEIFYLYARDAFYNGYGLSTEASTRRVRLCLLNNAQTSAVQVPATSTSPLNKGKSRQESSLSEESLLPVNGPHSKNFLDTAKSSQLSTSDSLASSGSCLPNEPQTSSSHNSDHPLPSSSLQDPPLYSESEGDDDATSVNSEDDTDDESNDMALEEVQAVYNKWRQIPVEQSPWASTASLLDKFKRLGILTKENLQH